MPASAPVLSLDQIRLFVIPGSRILSAGQQAFCTIPLLQRPAGHSLQPAAQFPSRRQPSRRRPAAGMATADAHPLWMSRVPTIVSMQQLEDDYGNTKAPKPAEVPQPLECTPRPEAPVADAVGACLPRYSFPAMECKIHPPQKRVRSFGDLHNALVPDIKETSDGW